jgi:hypothetical protein
MADTKISALPPSTTPLAGTEVLPIVQGGATKQVSVANLTAGRSFDALSMTLTSTDAGAAAAPLLDLYRDSASPAAADTLGEIEFNGEDSAGNKQQYALIHGSIISPTSGAEGGQLHFETTTAGVSTEKMIIGTNNLVINEIGAIYNVRIEGDTDANLFYTDATNSRIGMGTASPTTKLHLSQSNAGDYASVVLLSNSADAAGDRTGIYGSAPVGNALPYRGGITFWPGASGAVAIHTGNNAAAGDGQAMFVAGTGSRDVTVSTGNLIIGTSGKGIDFSATSHPAGMTSELLADYEEGTWTPILTTTGTDFTSVTYAAQTGEYVKIGRAIYYYFSIATSAVTIGSASGDVGVGGLPFSIGGGETTSYLSASGWVVNIPSSAEKRGGAQTFARLKYRTTSNGATTNMAVTDVSTGANEVLGCLYIVRSA